MTYKCKVIKKVGWSCICGVYGTLYKVKKLSGDCDLVLLKDDNLKRGNTVFVDHKDVGYRCKKLFENKNAFKVQDDKMRALCKEKFGIDKPEINQGLIIPGVHNRV